VLVNCFAHQYKSIDLDDTVDESFENIDRSVKQWQSNVWHPLSNVMPESHRGSQMNTSTFNTHKHDSSFNSSLTTNGKLQAVIISPPQQI